MQQTPSENKMIMPAPENKNVPDCVSVLITNGEWTGQVVHVARAMALEYVRLGTGTIVSDVNAFEQEGGQNG